MDNDVKLKSLRIGKEINGYLLVMTCECCPEQYDVYKNDEKVGYLRLRHGVFTVDCPYGNTITDRCFQLKWNWMTGVCPTGAQVRTRVGRSDSPDSSTKTIKRPSRWAFF